MAEHMPTPTPPWRIGATFDHHLNGYGIYASGCRVAIAGYLGGTETAKANAAFIVKAVNNHDALVKALSESRSALVAFKDAVEASQKMNGREYIGLGIQINDAIGRAYDTLSRVGGACE